MSHYYRKDMLVEAVQWAGQEIAGLTVNHKKSHDIVQVNKRDFLVGPGEAIFSYDLPTGPEMLYVRPGMWLLRYATGRYMAVSTEIMQEYFALLPVAEADASDGYHTFAELYRHRHALLMVVLRCYGHNCWKTRKTKDGRASDGWFIAGIETPYGQISYHLPEDYWEVLSWVPELERNWNYDGHTSTQVEQRLWQMATQ